MSDDMTRDEAIRTLVTPTDFMPHAERLELQVLRVKAFEVLGVSNKELYEALTHGLVQ